MNELDTIVDTARATFAQAATPAELEQLIISEIAKWSQAIKRAGIKADAP